MPAATAPDLYFGIPIVKTEKGDNGSLLVYGRATDGSLDLDDQIVDPEWARRALKEWFSDYANVRQMHSGSLPPAGVGLQLDDREDGQWLKSEVYEPGAVLQVEKGGYRAYSVGIAKPRIVRDASAPNGRIVDGIVVEVSLVDRPANPACKFSLTKGVGSEMQVINKAVTVTKGDDDDKDDDDSKDGMVDCPTCSGSGQPVGSDRPCGSCGGSGKVSKDKAKQLKKKNKVLKASGLSEDRIAWVLGGAPLEKMKSALNTKAQREAAKYKLRDDSGEVKYPINDCTDVNDAWGLRGASSLDKDKVEQHVRRAAKALNCPVPGDKEDKVAQPTVDEQTPPQPGEVPYAIRRLHDVCCAAYSVEDLKEAYPVLEKNGIAASLGPGAKLALWQMLNQEVSEDGGTGSEAPDIHRMGEAYKHLCEFLTVEDKGDQPMVIFDAHAELHKAFAEVNKDLMPTDGGPGIPTPSGQIQPGQFRRPYLSAGHQRQTGEGQARPRQAPPVNQTTSAADFQRPALTDGQERQSPANAKRAALDAMTALHDTLARQNPYLCPMQLETASQDNRDGSRPQAANLGAEPDVTKGAEPEMTAAEKAAAKAEKKIKKAEKQAKKQAELTKAFEPHLKKIAELQAQVADLERQPDTSQAAHRGITTSTVTKAADAEALAKRKADDERERAELMQQLEWQSVHAPDPEARLRAQDRMAAIQKAATAST